MKRRFSGEEWVIRRLVARDPAFRASWEQYEEVLEMVERWNASKGSLDRRTRDYTALAHELEQEIQERLGAEGRDE